MKPLRIAIIGAGGRGRGMADLARLSERSAAIVAAVDPASEKRELAATQFGIAAELLFSDHQDFLRAGLDVDATIIATDVRTHAEIASDCLKSGVPIFLEKPMTRTIDEALAVAATARATETPIMVGFNLRYAPYYRRLHELISGGAIGQLISIEWKEILSPAAWADGYCRATWYSQTKDVGGWLLEKSCHDIDQINWLAGARCARVSSFGSRRYFVPRPDVPSRCTDNCPIEPECYFSCFKLHPEGGAPLPEYYPPERWDLCVYHSGSDLVDRQVAALEYENGVTAAFSLLPVGRRGERRMQICGSEATLYGSDYDSTLRIYRHDCAEPICEDPAKETGEHFGADGRIIDAFLRYLDNPSVSPETSLDTGLEAMLAAGGIELAREEQRVVELDQWQC